MRVITAMMKHHGPKQTGEEESLHTTERSQGGNLEAGANAQAMGMEVAVGTMGAYWLLILACSTCLSKELRAKAEVRKFVCY